MKIEHHKDRAEPTGGWIGPNTDWPDLPIRDKPARERKPLKARRA